MKYTKGALYELSKDLSLFISCISMGCRLGTLLKIIYLKTPVKGYSKLS